MENSQGKPSTQATGTVVDFSQDLQNRLLKAVRSGALITDAHLKVLKRDISIGATSTKLHCYVPQLDAHGRLKSGHLIEFLIDRVVDYAIPRKTIEEAQAKFDATGSTAEIVRLHRRAKSTFTNIKTTGEGGELLLFALAEAVFELTQILCKMSLKTSTSMHYHGADGVYASLDDDDFLNLYWGESKLYSTASEAITDCLKSLSPFLREEFGEGATNARDLLLVNEYMDFTDPVVIAGLKRFFNRDHPASNKLRMCGFALVGFDNNALPKTGNKAVWEDMEAALLAELPKWQAHLGKRLSAESIEIFDIHFVCVPLRSVQEFRDAFLEHIGEW